MITTGRVTNTNNNVQPDCQMYWLVPLLHAYLHCDDKMKNNYKKKDAW